jgi:hypothetical protein
MLAEHKEFGVVYFEVRTVEAANQKMGNTVDQQEHNTDWFLLECGPYASGQSVQRGNPNRASSVL